MASWVCSMASCIWASTAASSGTSARAAAAPAKRTKARVTRMMV
eukprot:CAMPEP_0204263346 /NCGR_PEP_ID=MMETSP0468-20130131/8297_1 /ASSEMBLY_ACC=CAM_ASM_000383 /TAXON_ID=2969 /ORGANISM="Oxyrrhis marina" /LENGTH=43 /DNA_ID= /DNA_START= /DNA_END= /DNA_ORIENTATION=